MSKIYPLFSSSKGNSTYIGTKKSGILIDAGVSCKKLIKALEDNELSANAVQGIFITHEHSDHIKALSVLTKKHNIPVYATPGTLKYLDENDHLHSEGIEITDKIAIADMEVKAFHTPHDAVESCGYRINLPDGQSCAVCTDLGWVTDEVEQNVRGCQAVLLEANYDEQMLKDGPYPYSLKSRIRSKKGHLSNVDSGSFAKHLIETGTTRLILGHLSPTNNTPVTADRTVHSQLSDFVRNKDFTLQVAPFETQGEYLIF